MSDKEDDLGIRTRSKVTKGVKNCDESKQSLVENSLNLSEDESSDEELKPDIKTPIISQTEPNEAYNSSSVLSPVSSNNQDTMYDFSGIIKSQTDIINARECFTNVSHNINHDTMSSNERKESSDGCSIEELLKQCEKNISQEEEETSSDELPDECVSQSVEITLPSNALSKELRRQRNKESALTKHLNKVRSERQRDLHKAHLLCLIAHGNFISEVINSEFLYGYALSFLPPGYSPPPLVTVSYIQKLLKWFGNTFPQKKHKKTGSFSFAKLEEVFTSFKPCSVRDSVILFVSLLRGLSLTARIVINLTPVPLKIKKIDWVPSDKSERVIETEPEFSNVTTKPICQPGPSNPSKSPSKQSLSDKRGLIAKKCKSSVTQSASAKLSKMPKKKMDKSNPCEPGPSTSKTDTGKRASGSGVVSRSDSNSKKKSTQKPSSVKLLPDKKSFDTARLGKSSGKKVNQPGKGVLIESSSSSSEDQQSDGTETTVKCGVDYWAEVYVESEERWISVDLFSHKIDCVREISNRCTQPIAYIVGWKNDGSLKDVTLRYAPTWLTKKYRVEEQWWSESLRPFRSKNCELDLLEDDQIKEIMEKAPMPTNINEFKNHPLYALPRHLLKYEAIYPKDAVPLGYIKGGEPVYSRFCVQVLFAREKWLQQGKAVKIGEKPYKIVNARSKPDKFASQSMGKVTKKLELFGAWQVEDYIAPPAVDGKVPKNQYGNVEVYKPSMLPAGTVHLQVPGLLKLAQKLSIDCAPAVIGWQHHNGMSHPVIEGIVVCSEYQDILLDAWNSEIDHVEQRSASKRKLRAYKNWLKFCKTLRIKEHLKKKYNFGENDTREDEPLSKLPKKS